jgi:hypothetical protein
MSGKNIQIEKEKLTLALFVTWIRRANHSNNTTTLDNFTISADFLH